MLVGAILLQLGKQQTSSALPAGFGGCFHLDFEIDSRDFVGVQLSPSRRSSSSLFF